MKKNLYKMQPNLILGLGALFFLMAGMILFVLFEDVGGSGDVFLFRYHEGALGMGYYELVETCALP